MVLIPDVRIGWRDELVNIVNASFKRDATGWSVGATSMHSAGTSITRTTGDGVVGRSAFLAGFAGDGEINVCAELVTTATNGSGVSLPFVGTAVAGRTYRVQVWLRRTAGTTSAKLILGSNGTAGDRATSTMTLSGTWTRYSLDWTPAADRADARLVIANNAASSGTFRISLPEVFEAMTQVGVYGRDEVLGAAWTRGANFDGTTESPASLELTLDNRTHAYDPDNGSSILAGLIEPGLPVSVRIIDTSIPKVYGAFYGRIRRFLPMPEDLRVQVLAEDPFRTWMRKETTVTPAIDRRLADFRTEVLADVVPGTTSDLWNLDLTGPELDIPFTAAAQRSALNVLDEINIATGSVHWIFPEPFLDDPPYVYETKTRTSLLGWTSAEHYDDTVAGATGVVGLDPYDITDEALVTSQRVVPTIRGRTTIAQVVWESGQVPFSVGAADRTIVALIEGDPVDWDLVPIVEQTGTKVATTVSYGTLVEITLSGGGSSTITRLALQGRRFSAIAAEAADSGSGEYPGRPIDTDYLPSLAAAQGLADWIVYRYADVKGRPGLTAQNRTAAHVSRRVADVIIVTNGRVSWVAKPFLIRTIRTEVSDNALVWRTHFTLEAAPATVTLFSLDGSAAQGLGGVGVLAP